MMVSTKGRYALRVMIDLAEHDDGRFIPLKEIAARQGISEKYLESIVKLLARSGDLFGMRGKGGRLPTDPRSRGVHRGQHPPPDGGGTGPGKLPGPV